MSNSLRIIAAEISLQKRITTRILASASWRTPKASYIEEITACFFLEEILKYYEMLSNKIQD